jgi:hypothetical protein
VGGLQHLAATASTFQKIAAAVIALISLVVLSATTVSRYAPWAWAADVEVRQRAIERKIDTLSEVVLQSQISDTEARIAELEAKARTLKITPTEAEVLRAQRRRLEALDRQVRGLGTRP